VRGARPQSIKATEIEATEIEPERAISEVRTMPFVWLAVDDEPGTRQHARKNRKEGPYSRTISAVDRCMLSDLAARQWSGE
jgi:hypothetical protein